MKRSQGRGEIVYTFTKLIRGYIPFSNRCFEVDYSWEFFWKLQIVQTTYKYTLKKSIDVLKNLNWYIVELLHDNLP